MAASGVSWLLFHVGGTLILISVRNDGHKEFYLNALLFWKKHKDLPCLGIPGISSNVSVLSEGLQKA